jgi:hypothetical protein
MIFQVLVKASGKKRRKPAKNPWIFAVDSIKKGNVNRKQY